MTQIEKPMLAGKAPADLADLNFPVLASPKLDGVRCLIIDGKALTRTFKPIPNTFVREWCEANLPDGFDGELLFRNNWSAPFKEISGAVRRETGEPDFEFAAFDWAHENYETGFEERFIDLQTFFYGAGTPRADIVPHTKVHNVHELLSLHARHMSEGYEGTMVRDPDGPYKFGRSTTKKGELLKIKDFADEEAVVIDVIELMHNDNEAEQDAFGRTKRATHQENLRPAGTMGSLTCKFADDTEFSVGTGFSAEERAELWFDHNPCGKEMRQSVVGRTVKIKHQPDPGGRQPGQKPRFPVFLGFRDMVTDV